jgi:HNH endonuclease
MRTCTIDGCEKPRYQGYRMCSTHAMRKHRYGDPHISRDRRGRIRQDDRGYLVQYGVRVHRTVLLASIGPGWHPCNWCRMPVCWELSFPKDPRGLVVDHLDGDRANNTPTNLVPACGVCNWLRGRWGDDCVRKRARGGVNAGR